MAAALAKLGESEAAPGYLLLQLLSMQGWRISVLARVDGERGVRVTATKLGQQPVDVSGASVADIAVQVVKEATGHGE
jgi:hypothetical protein